MRQERGFSFFGVVFLIAILGGLVSVLIKVLPPWMDFRMISEATQNIIEEPRVGLQPNNKIMDRIENQLSINNVSLGSLGKDAITLSREDGVLTATIDYLVEQPVYQTEHVTITINMQVYRTHEASLGE